MPFNVRDIEWEIANALLKDKPDGTKLRRSRKKLGISSEVAREDYTHPTSKKSVCLQQSFIKVNSVIYAIGFCQYVNQGHYTKVKHGKNQAGDDVVVKISKEENQSIYIASETKIEADLDILIASCKRVDADKHVRIQLNLGRHLDKVIYAHRDDYSYILETMIHTIQQVKLLHSGGLSKSKTGYIHRDIKGNNILVAEDGCIHIIDFGSSCRRDQAYVKTWYQHTVDQYAAPEVLACGFYSNESDIYALGILFKEFLLYNLHGTRLCRLLNVMLRYDRNERLPLDWMRVILITWYLRSTSSDTLQKELVSGNSVVKDPTEAIALTAIAYAASENSEYTPKTISTLIKTPHLATALNIIFNKFNSNVGSTSLFTPSILHSVIQDTITCEVIVFLAHYNLVEPTLIKKVINNFELRSLLQIMAKNAIYNNPEHATEEDKKIYLYHAAASGIVELYQHVASFAMYEPIEDNSTPLRVAAARGHIEMVRFLLSDDNPYLSNTLKYINTALEVNGLTALHSAVCNRHYQVVRLLLDAGADYQVNAAGKTPLSLAKQVGAIVLIRYFLSATCPRARTIRDLAIAGHDTPLVLSYSIVEESIENTLALLTSGIDVNGGCADSSALQLALNKKRFRQVFYLLLFGARVDSEASQKLEKNKYSLASIIFKECKQPRFREPQYIEKSLTLFAKIGIVKKSGVGVCPHLKDAFTEKARLYRLFKTAINSNCKHLLSEAARLFIADPALDQCPLVPHQPSSRTALR